jgi:hyperosmotically inducible periplasmic protein
MTGYRSVLIATVASLFLINIPLFASEMDDRIELSAKQSYVFKTFLEGDDITIQSKDGIVTLTGTVSKESSKSLAWETVANLPGVVIVNNKLAINGEVPSEDTDAWLITNVKSRLLFHRNVNATETEILVKDGTVTLRGEATSEAQKDLTTEYVWDVQGVKDVKNEMIVSTDAMNPGKTTMGEKVDAISESIDDASIIALVKTTLLYHRSTSALNTTVSTKDGVVYLGGKAKNAAEEDLATKLVSDVHGVKRVVNNMSIEGTESKTN